MTKEQVQDIVQHSIESADTEALGLHVVSVSDEPVDGYWYVLVEPELEPSSVLDYYTLLARIEDDLSSQGNIRVLLTPAINDASEYEIEGDWIEVIQRNSGNLSVMPKRSHGGPHYSATFWPDGRLAMTGTVRGGTGEIEPPPSSWIDKFKKAVKLHLQLHPPRRDATA